MSTCKSFLQTAAIPATVKHENPCGMNRPCWPDLLLLCRSRRRFDSKDELLLGMVDHQKYKTMEQSLWEKLTIGEHKQ